MSFFFFFQFFLFFFLTTHKIPHYSFIWPLTLYKIEHTITTCLFFFQLEITINFFSLLFIYLLSFIFFLSSCIIFPHPPLPTPSPSLLYILHVIHSLTHSAPPSTSSLIISFIQVPILHIFISMQLFNVLFYNYIHP